MANEYRLKSYTGGAVATTLNGDITNLSASIVVASGSTLPSGASGPFVVAVDHGQANEEHVLVSARSGATLTVLERGYDNTTAGSHSSGAAVVHVLDAHTVQHANRVVSGYNETGTKGATGLPLVATGTLPAWQQLGTLGIADAAVTVAKLATSIPRGIVPDGYKKLASPHTGISSITDVNDMSIEFTAVAGRLYRMDAYGLFTGDAGTDAYLAITNSANTVEVAGQRLVQSGSTSPGLAIWTVEEPGGGVVTYKVRAQKASGSGVVNLADCRFMIADVGLA